MIRPDGSTFIADVSSTTFTTAEDELRACVIFRDITDQVAQREQLEYQRRELERLAMRDPLTGLLNRRGFMAEAQRALDFADRGRASLILLFCDLDNLKAINDRYGHQTGDQTLARLGTAIADTIRSVDVGARLSPATSSSCSSTVRPAAGQVRSWSGSPTPWGPRTGQALPPPSPPASPSDPPGPP